MTKQSLEQKLQNYSNPADMLYNSPAGVFTFPITPEFSNWRDEQEAWRKTAILQDMSHHMTDVYFEGPDIYKLLSDLGINSFKNFGPMQAKQIVVCNYDGYVIGDAILFCEKENVVSIVGKPNTANWVAFHAETGDYDVKVTKYERPSADTAERSLFRYQVQGPNADKIFEEVNGGLLPEIKFFKMGKFKVGEHQVTALNHRMSGAPGYEFWGPMEDGASVKKLLLEAGEKYGLKQIGGRIYPVTALESGWIGGTIPAIYTGDKMKKYREWLPAQGYEGSASMGGSFSTDNIEDLYVTPYDMGYGFMVKFDHDFIGREALEKIQEGQRRKKVRLVWNADDVLEIFASQLSDGDRYKYMETPTASYATFPIDEVLLDGKRIGISTYPVYSANVRGWFSLAMVDEGHVEEGKELAVTWGEPDGGSAKPTVERHVQKAVRVTVDTKPVKRD